jgi:hypothetical protein
MHGTSNARLTDDQPGAPGVKSARDGLDEANPTALWLAEVTAAAPVVDDVTGSRIASLIGGAS